LACPRSFAFWLSLLKTKTSLFVDFSFFSETSYVVEYGCNTRATFFFFFTLNGWKMTGAGACP